MIDDGAGGCPSPASQPRDIRSGLLMPPLFLSIQGLPPAVHVAISYFFSSFFSSSVEGSLPQSLHRMMLVVALAFALQVLVGPFPSSLGHPTDPNYSELVEKDGPSDWTESQIDPPPPPPPLAGLPFEAERPLYIPFLIDWLCSVLFLG